MVLHKCDVPRCVNPDHLFQGTAQDNSDDMRRKGRGRSNPLRGEMQPAAKLTEQQVREARQLKETRFQETLWGRARLASYKEIGEKFGVSPRTIQNAVAGKTWKHLDSEREKGD